MPKPREAVLREALTAKVTEWLKTCSDYENAHEMESKSYGDSPYCAAQFHRGAKEAFSRVLTEIAAQPDSPSKEEKGEVPKLGTCHAHTGTHQQHPTCRSWILLPATATQPASEEQYDSEFYRWLQSWDEPHKTKTIKTAVKAAWFASRAALKETK